MLDDFQKENIRIAVSRDIISPLEALMAFKAIRTDNYQNIKELYRERQNEKTMADR